MKFNSWIVRESFHTSFLKNCEMPKLQFLREDGQGNIFDETGREAMDIVDEEADPFRFKMRRIKMRLNEAKIL